MCQVWLTPTKFCCLDSLPPRNSKLWKQYDTYIERQYASGKSLYAILKDLHDIGFKSSGTPFYDHYRYLEDVYKDSRQRNKNVPQKKKRPEMFIRIYLVIIISLAIFAINYNKSIHNINSNS